MDIIYPKNKQQLKMWYKHLFEEFKDALASKKDEIEGFEEMWRGRHWEQLKKAGELLDTEEERQKPHPKTPLVFSTVENMLGDLVDSYPEANLIGRSGALKEVAEIFEKALKDGYERDLYKRTYRKAGRAGFKCGFYVQKTTFDPEKLGGLGDITTEYISYKKCLWDPEFENIQEGRAFFTFDYIPPESAARYYPDLSDQDVEVITGGDTDEEERNQKQQSRGNPKTCIAEMWYRKVIPTKDEMTGQYNYEYQCHMAQFVGDHCVYWSEEDERYRETGIFRHGMLPFVMGVMIPDDGEPVGISVVNIFAEMQHYMNKMDQIALMDAWEAGANRYVYDPSLIDEKKLLDYRYKHIPTLGSGDVRTAVLPLTKQPLNAQAINYKESNRNAIKEESGQNVYTRGEGGPSATTATGIMALKDAGDKRMRLILSETNDTYYDVTWQRLSLMLQYYDIERFVEYIIEAIPENDGSEVGNLIWQLKYISLRNNVEQVLQQGDINNFNIRLKIQRASVITSAYYNEVASMLAGMGLPMEIVLKVMDFEGKESVLAELENMKRQAMQAQAQAMEPGAQEEQGEQQQGPLMQPDGSLVI